MAFFRVELHREARALGQRCGEIDAVMPATDYLARIARRNVVAVYKVETRQVGDAVPQRVIDFLLHFVPAHVRHLEMLAVFVQVLAEELHGAREQADAINTAVLFAAVEQGLHADTNTEKRTILTDFTHLRVKTQATDFGHAIADRTHTREHYAVGFANHAGIAGNQHPTGANVLQRLGHRVQVTHAVIDYRHCLHQSTPLVEGICPAMRSSSATAMRSARPKALNTVSIWW